MPINQPVTVNWIAVDFGFGLVLVKSSNKPSQIHAHILHTRHITQRFTIYYNLKLPITRVDSWFLTRNENVITTIAINVCVCLSEYGCILYSFSRFLLLSLSLSLPLSPSPACSLPLSVAHCPFPLIVHVFWIQSTSYKNPIVCEPIRLFRLLLLPPIVLIEVLNSTLSILLCIVAWQAQRWTKCSSHIY